MSRPRGGGLGPRRLSWNDAAPADFLEHLHPDTEQEPSDMAQTPDTINVTLKVNMTPLLAALAMQSLETWRVEAGPAAEIDVVIANGDAIVRLYPDGTANAGSLRGEGATFWEAAQAALAEVGR